MTNVQEFKVRVEAAYSLLKSLTEPKVSYRPTPERWSIKEVVGHLIDSAANNHERFIRLQNGNATLLGYDQRFWVSAGNYQEMEFQSILQLWISYNDLLLSIIGSIEPESLTNVWNTQSGEQLTLSFLIEDYYGHLEHHIQKIKDRL